MFSFRPMVSYDKQCALVWTCVDDGGWPKMKMLRTLNLIGINVACRDHGRGRRRRYE